MQPDLLFDTFISSANCYQLTTLSLCVAVEKGIWQVNAEKKPFEHHNCFNCRDFQKQLNCRTCYDEVIIRVGWEYLLAVDVHLNNCNIVYIFHHHTFK